LNFKTILFTEDNSLAFITLNRPEKLNAFNQIMLTEMVEVFDYIDKKDSIRAVILSGSGRAFCAGADLSAKTFDTEFDNLKNYKEDFRRDSGGILTLRMYKCLKPIIVACNGAAVGIGATMQLAADVRIASTLSKFSFPFAKRGIAPDACSSWFLPKIVGISKALEWSYSGELFDASVAYEAGLISYLVEPDELMDKAIEIANKFIKESSSVSIALTRQMMWSLSSTSTPEEAHIIDSKVIDSRGASGDAAEGVMSFLEKRDANYPDKISSDMPSIFPWIQTKFKDPE
jgi:enoyl-CoA hydratase/carnithine racemase